MNEQNIQLETIIKGKFRSYEDAHSCVKWLLQHENKNFRAKKGNTNKSNTKMHKTKITSKTVMCSVCSKQLSFKPETGGWRLLSCESLKEFLSHDCQLRKANKISARRVGGSHNLQDAPHNAVTDGIWSQKILNGNVDPISTQLSRILQLYSYPSFFFNELLSHTRSR